MHGDLVDCMYMVSRYIHCAIGIYIVYIHCDIGIYIVYAV